MFLPMISILFSLCNHQFCFIMMPPQPPTQVCVCVYVGVCTCSCVCVSVCRCMYVCVMGSVNNIYVCMKSLYNIKVRL